MTTGGSGTEVVQYQIDVTTSGQEGITRLREELKALGAQVTKYQKGSQQSTDLQTKAVGAAKEQSLAYRGTTGELGNLRQGFMKMTDPLRKVTGLFGLLTPSSLGAAFGLTAIVGAAHKFNQVGNQNLRTTYGLAGGLNQYTNATLTGVEAQAKARVEADKLGISYVKTMEAHQRMTPIIRDYGIQQSILQNAVSHSRNLNQDLGTSVDQLTQAYSEGALIVRRDGTSTYAFNMEAVQGLTAASEEAGDAAIRMKGKTDQAFSAVADSIKAKLGAGTTRTITQLKQEFLALVNPDEFAGQELYGQGDRSFKGRQLPAERTSSIGASLSGLFKRIFTSEGTLKERPFRHKGRRGGGYVQSAGDIGEDLIGRTPGSSAGGVGTYARGGVVTRPTRAWVGEAGPELVVPLTEPNRSQFFRRYPRLLREWSKGKGGGQSHYQEGGIGGTLTAAPLALPDLSKEMGNTIFENWNTEVEDPFYIKIRDLFSKENMTGFLKDGFVGTPIEIWSTITSNWASGFQNPFTQGLGDVFNWDTIKEMLGIAFVETPVAIWEFIKTTWDEKLHQPLSEALGSLFSWDAIKEVAEKIFVDLPSKVWEWIASTWKSAVYDPFMDKLNELLDWDRIKEFLKTAFVDWPKEAWSWIKSAWNDGIYGPFTDKLKELLDWERIKELLKTAFVDWPKAAWEWIVSTWSSALDSPFVTAIKELLSWDRIKEFLKTAFVDWPKEAWSWVVSTWNAALDVPFVNKIQELLGWDRIKGYIRATFINWPSEMWAWIQTQWEGSLDIPFITKIGELLSWERIQNYLKAAFIGVSGFIWTTISSTWDQVLRAPLWEALTALFDVAELKSLVIGAFESVMSGLETTWSDVKSIIVDPVTEALSDVTTAVTGALEGLLTTLWSWATETASTVASTLRDAIRGSDDSNQAAGDSQDSAKDSSNSAKSAKEEDKDAGDSARDAKREAKDAGDSASDASRYESDARQSAKDAARYASIARSKAGRGGGGGGTFLAEGGIVRRPTYSMIGEEGPEAVIPLTQQILSQLGGGGNQPISITIQIDGRKFEQFVVSSLDRKIRLRGGR